MLRRYTERMIPRSSLVLLLTFVLPYGASAETTPRVRVLDARLKSLFDHGLTQSPTLRAQVDKVEASSILVFVDGDMRMPERLGAQLTFVTSVNDVRYVRVDLNVMLPPRRQIALLAHELQHALEIADRPEIQDIEAMESFYETSVSSPSTTAVIAASRPKPRSRCRRPLNGNWAGEHRERTRPRCIEER